MLTPKRENDPSDGGGGHDAEPAGPCNAFGGGNSQVLAGHEEGEGCQGESLALVPAADNWLTVLLPKGTELSPSSGC